MLFTIQREAFLKPLKAVAGVVERRHHVMHPILSNVLIEVTEAQIFLTTTDQEVELNACGDLIQAKSIPGKITLPLRKLLEICRTLPEGALLTFKEEEKDKISIRSGRSRFTLSGLPVEQFPTVSMCAEGKTFRVSNHSFKQLIDDLSFAMAEQDVRYYLNGMLLEMKSEGLYGVAADGHRLALSKINNVFRETDFTLTRLIVPRKGVLELQRILENIEEEVILILNPQHLCVKTKNISLTSKLLEGKFPDYESIVPKGGDKIVVGKRHLLKEAFLRAAALCNDKSRGVRLRLSPGCMNILATNMEQDEVEEDVEVQYQGEELEIGFNIKYLIDFLSVLQDEWIKFTFTNANSSARVEGVNEGSNENSKVYVIMPMRI